MRPGKSCTWKRWILSQLRVLAGGEAAILPDCPSLLTMVSISGSHPPSVFAIWQDRRASRWLKRRFLLPGREPDANCSRSPRSQSPSFFLSGWNSCWEPPGFLAPPIPSLDSGGAWGQMRFLEILQRAANRGHSFYSLGFPSPKWEISEETAAQAAGPQGDPVPTAGKQRAGAASLRWP